jgi:hypothetical protein
MVATAPPDAPGSASPRAAGDACAAALTAGNRTAQLAKINPSTAKNAVAAARTRIISLLTVAESAILFSGCTNQDKGENRDADNRVGVTAPPVRRQEHPRD